MHHSLVTSLEDVRAWSTDLLTRLVACPSVTGETSQIMDVLEPELTALGFDVESVEIDLDALAGNPEFSPPQQVRGQQPPVLHATYPDAPSAGSGRGDLMLFAHTDTEPVHEGWSTDPFELRIDGDRACGLGVADDKAGVVSILAAVRAVRQAGIAPTWRPRVVLGAGKQGGALGTLPGTIAAHGVAAAVYSHPAESEQGLAQLKVGSRGVAQLEVLVPGITPTPLEPRTPLSADPRQGRSAVLRAARLAAALSDASTDDLVRAVTALTSQAGPFEVPDAARLVLACWFTDQDVEPVLARLEREVQGLAADEWELRHPPTVRLTGMRANPASCRGSAFAAWATDLVQDTTGQAVQDYGWHSASDIRFPLRCLDVPAVGFGARAGSFYGPGEWVDLSSMHSATAVLARMLTEADLP